MPKRRATRTGDDEPIFRREKGRPCDDFWHTITLGVPIALFLFVALPPVFAILRRLF